MKTWQKAVFIILLVGFIIASDTISFISMARTPFEFEYQTAAEGEYGIDGWVLFSFNGNNSTREVHIDYVRDADGNNSDSSKPVFAVGGDYTLKYLQSFLSFGTGCYLIAHYYEIPLLTFSAINVFFIASTYFRNLLTMGVDATFGFLSKKIERKYNAVYLTFAVFGLMMVIFDFSFIIPDGIAAIIDTRWKGINSFNIFKIFGAHLLANGWSGF